MKCESRIEKTKKKSYMRCKKTNGLNSKYHYKKTNNVDEQKNSIVPKELWLKKMNNYDFIKNGFLDFTLFELYFSWKCMQVKIN